MFSKSQTESLRLLRKYFEETASSKIDEDISSVMGDKKGTVPTVEEYFEHFQDVFAYGFF